MEIGNIIGAPTMQYSPEYERNELLRRGEKVARIVQEQLGIPTPAVDPEKYRRNPGIKHIDKPDWLE